MSKKQIAVITGASQGIGRAISIKLASEGYFTVLSGRNEENLKKTAELVSHVNDHYQVSITDVTSEVDIEKLFKETAELGELEILVNNAGVGTFKAVEDITLKEWKDMLDVNLTGAFLATREAVKVMKNNRSVGNHFMQFIWTIHRTFIYPIIKSWRVEKIYYRKNR